MPNRAVFLDRDGTIAEDAGYCSSPDDFKLFPDASKALKLLAKHFKLIMITNQSGIGRGYFSEDALRRIHQKMRAELAREGAGLDGIYYCPHHPDADCQCRKPRPGLILRAAAEHNIDLERSFVVGDEPRDIELGRAVGCRTILLNAPPLANHPGIIEPDAVAGSFLEAAHLILEQEGLLTARSRLKGRKV